jgi:hypothetical protein
VAPDRGRLTRITDTPGHVQGEPAWSPDGHLAFVRSPFLVWDQDELMVTRADGTDPLRVAGGMDISRPAWSPDGSRIAFLEGAINLAYEDVLTCPHTGLPRLFVPDVAMAASGPLLELAAPETAAPSSRHPSGLLTALVSPWPAVASTWWTWPAGA